MGRAARRTAKPPAAWQAIAAAEATDVLVNMQLQAFLCFMRRLPMPLDTSDGKKPFAGWRRLRTPGTPPAAPRSEPIRRLGIRERFSTWIDLTPRGALRRRALKLSRCDAKKM